MTAILSASLSSSPLALASFDDDNDHCSPYECGANSPHTGTELHLGGKANDDGYRIDPKATKHPRYPGRKIKLRMDGHEIVATVIGKNGRHRKLRGRALVNLQFDVVGPQTGAGQANRMTVRIGSVDFIDLWYEGDDAAIQAPTYNFTYSRPSDAQGSAPYELCPFPSEEIFGADVESENAGQGIPQCRIDSWVPPNLGLTLHAPDPVPGNSALSEPPAKTHKTTTQGPGSFSAQLEDELPPGARWIRNRRAQRTCRFDYHALAFAGDRYDGRRVRTPETASNKWMTIACRGSALFKMHLSGHTDAAVEAANKALNSKIQTPNRQQKQAFLNALTASYCGPSGKAYTVPGQPLQFDPYFQFNERPNHRAPQGNFKIASSKGPSTPAKPRFQQSSKRTRPFYPLFHFIFANADSHKVLEAVWNEHGAQCLNVPRRAKMHSKLRDTIRDACGTPIPNCGFQASPDPSFRAPVVTYTPGTCRQLTPEGDYTCTKRARILPCDCDVGCEERGTCCADAQKAQDMGCEFPPPIESITIAPASN